MSMERDTEQKWATLSRLAATLDVSIERFFTEVPTNASTAGTDDCLRLWSQITTEEGRRHAMTAMQMIVDLERK